MYLYMYMYMLNLSLCATDHITQQQPTNEDEGAILEVFLQYHWLVEHNIVGLKLPTVVGGVHDLPLLFPLAQTADKATAIVSLEPFPPGSQCKWWQYKHVHVCCISL